MDAAHLAFNKFKSIESRINRKIVFISEQTVDRSKYFEWIPISSLRQVCFQTFRAIDMANEVSGSKNFDLVFIFEHKPWYSYLLYLKCILRKKPVFFIVHGLQQTYRNSFFHRLGFKVLLYIEKKYDFWPIHLELTDKDVPGVRCFTKSIVIPHPLPDNVRLLTKQKDKFRIGILGIIRPDKPIKPLIDLLSQYDFGENVEILIGTTNYSMPEHFNNLPFKIIDTSTSESYTNFISTLHIVVNNFERDQFYFRPSGIINDSIAGGCLIVAPNYPVFKAQVNIPCTVGELFDSLDEIPVIITRALMTLKNNSVNFQEWIDYRSDNKLINDLSVNIQERIRV